MGEMQISEMVYILGAALIAISLLMANLVLLRVFYSIASIVFIFYGLLQEDQVLIASSSLFLLINLYYLLLYLISIRKVKLPKKLDEIYQTYNTHLTPAEFKHLMDHSKRKIYYNEMILEQGKDVEELMMIVSGKVDIDCDGAIVNSLKPGNFIGEFGILTDSKASASVISKGLVEVSVWEKAAINREKKLRELVSVNLVAKIVSSNKLQKREAKEEQAITNGVSQR